MVADATRSILKAKQNRKQTVMNLGNSQMEEAVEKASRRVKALLTLGRKKGLVKKEESPKSKGRRRRGSLS